MFGTYILIQEIGEFSLVSCPNFLAQIHCRIEASDNKQKERDLEE